MEIDDKFIPTYGVQMIAGRNFGPKEYINYQKQEARVLINELLMKNLGFKNAEDAINKKIEFDLGQFKMKSEIIGVMKNFHQRSLKEPYEPILFYSPNLPTGNIFL